MIKKTISYTDYDGNKRTEDFYFHMSEEEVVSFQRSVNGGIRKQVERIAQAQDESRIIDIFKDLIKRSYGVKSPDGRRFIKNEEVFNDFAQTPAYSIMFMELARDDKKAIEFLNGIVPASVSEENGSLKLVNNDNV